MSDIESQMILAIVIIVTAWYLLAYILQYAPVIKI
jgi:hypothetical protein